MPIAHRIVQNAYVVGDLDQAIAQWHGLWGIGPFFVRRHIVLEQVLYRGQPAELDFSAAYVQAGPIMVELVEQHDDRPSAFRDMYAPGQQGLHHVAVVPDDYDQWIAHYAALGYPLAGEMRTASGRGAAFVDTRAALGHMTEVYRPGAGLEALYREVASAAAGWDRRALTIEVDPSR